MKLLFTLNWRLLVLLLMAYTFSGSVYSQCDNFSSKLTVTDSPCGANGSILVELSGPDVEGSDPSYSDLQYRAFLTGNKSDSLSVQFATNKLVGNLIPGKYTIEVKGKCKQTNGYIAKPLKYFVEVKQVGIWRPLEVVTSVVTHSLSCLPSGVIRFTKFGGGLPPYKLEITAAPVGYTPKVLFDQMTWPTGNYDVTGLIAGTYTIKLTESSQCQSFIEMNVVMEANIEGMPVNIFAGGTTPYAYWWSALSDCNTIRLNKNSTSTVDLPYQYFIENWETYFEYFVYYPGDNISNPNDLVWSNFAAGSALILENLRYSISEIQMDRTGKAPNILVRAKGCTTIRDYPILFKVPYKRGSPYYEDCGKGYLDIGLWGDYDGTACYPVSWKVYDITDPSNETFVTESVTSLGFGSTQKSGPYDTGRYRIYFTDAGGYTWTSVNNEFPIATTTAKDLMTTNIFTAACREEYAPYMYLATSSAKTRDIKRIVYKGTQKNTTNSSSSDSFWVDDPTFPAPSLTDIDMSQVPTDSLAKYPVTILPWAKTIEDVVGYNNVLNGQLTYFQLLKDKSEFLPSPNKGEYYRHVFDVYDYCGDTPKSVIIYGNPYTISHIAEPVINIQRGCLGEIEFTVPNIENLMQRNYLYAGGGVADVTEYMIVYEKPAGATVSYTNTISQYINSSSQTIVTDKVGRYVFLVNETPNLNAYHPDLFCSKFYEVIVDELPIFELDYANTAAYRCAGSSKGQGLIEVKVKNGMGPYKFDLYAATDINHTTSLQSNTDGKFSGWNVVGEDDYVVVAYDYGCAPQRIVSFEQKVSVYDLANTPVAWTDESRLCIGSEIHLYSLALGETEYDWVFDNGLWSWSYTGRNPVIPDATLDMNGKFHLTVTVPGCPGTKAFGEVSISVGEPLLYWNPDAVDGNWFNNQNWLDKTGSVSQYLPAPCTTVHIPGDADHYPNLSNASSDWDQFGYPVCDSIIYHYGGETAYPSYLMYNRSFVQYDFGYYQNLDWYDITGDEQPWFTKDVSGVSPYPGIGSRTTPVIPRAKWAMVSAPLKNIVGGDFGLAGHPSIYQRSFNTTSPEDGKPALNDFTNAFSKNNISIASTDNAIALWAPDYADWVGAKNHGYLEALEGVIELPYLFNESIAPHRPLQEYSASDSTSVFYYFNYNTLAKDENTPPDRFARGGKSYRFIFEEANNYPEKIKVGDAYISIFNMEMSKPQSGERIMIGNPLMSHIDFDKLYALNSGKISNSYQIVDALTGSTETYMINYPFNTLTKDIAPLQAFIISRSNPTLVGEKLLFHLEGNDGVVVFGAGNTSLPKPRSESAIASDQGAILIKSTIVSTKGTDQSSVMFNYTDLSDLTKTVTPDYFNKIAYVYSINDADNKLYGILNKNGTPKPAVVRLGVTSYYAGSDIRLDITPSGSLIKTVTLVDKLNSSELDVTSGGSYNFSHRIGSDGTDIERFELHITYNEGIVNIVDNEEANGFLSVTCHTNSLSISSSKAIAGVNLTSLAGVLFFSDVVSADTSYQKHLRVASGAYLVQIIFTDGTVQTKKILVK